MEECHYPFGIGREVELFVGIDRLHGGKLLDGTHGGGEHTPEVLLLGRLVFSLVCFSGGAARIEDDIATGQYCFGPPESSRFEALLQLGHLAIQRTDAAKKTCIGWHLRMLSRYSDCCLSRRGDESCHRHIPAAASAGKCAT